MPVEPFYVDESVTLYCGDCRDVLPMLGRFDLLLTDPPYGIGINKSHRLATSRGFIGATWDAEPIDRDALDLILNKAAQHIVWGGNYYSMPPARCFLIWDKQNDGRDFADCEFAWTSIDAVARIFRMQPMKMDGGKVHPTQKPEALMQWCIGKAVGTVQSVLDPFAGSGTALVAAKRLGIRSVGIELNPAYCDVIVSRLRQGSLLGGVA